MRIYLWDYLLIEAQLSRLRDLCVVLFLCLSVYDFSTLKMANYEIEIQRLCVQNGAREYSVMERDQSYVIEGADMQSRVFIPGHPFLMMPRLDWTS